VYVFLAWAHSQSPCQICLLGRNERKQAKHLPQRALIGWVKVELDFEPGAQLANS